MIILFGSEIRKMPVKIPYKQYKRFERLNITLIENVGTNVNKKIDK